MSAEVFKRNKKSYHGFNIESMLRVKPVAGEIGLEIEVEGNSFRKQDIPAPWKYVKDGSLRGEDNAEYIFKKPLKFEDVPAALDSLWEMFRQDGSVLDESNRTSVHVHLNAQKFHLNRLCAFFALYFSVEEVLTEWCGDHRVGNLFCLRAKDAPAIISVLKKFLNQDYNIGGNENLHYAGLNAHSLSKFGSIEIRSLRGCTDPETILHWIGALERIYRLSETFKDPRHICDEFSGHGPLEYFQMVLGDKAGTIRNNIQWDNQRLYDSLYEGIRLAQDLCYCRDWSKYEPIELETDPFGRSSSEVASSLSSLTHYYTETLSNPHPQAGVIAVEANDPEHYEYEEDYHEYDEEF